MARKVPKEARKANERADEAGRVWECVRCKDWTGYPFAHLFDEHQVTRLEVDDFRLVRGALHSTRRPRAEPGYPDIPLF